MKPMPNDSLPQYLTKGLDDGLPDYSRLFGLNPKVPVLPSPVLSPSPRKIGHDPYTASHEDSNYNSCNCGCGVSCQNSRGTLGRESIKNLFEVVDSLWSDEFSVHYRG